MIMEEMINLKAAETALHSSRTRPLISSIHSPVLSTMYTLSDRTAAIAAEADELMLWLSDWKSPAESIFP